MICYDLDHNTSSNALLAKTCDSLTRQIHLYARHVTHTTLVPFTCTQLKQCRARLSNPKNNGAQGPLLGSSTATPFFRRRWSKNAAPRAIRPIQHKTPMWTSPTITPHRPRNSCFQNLEGIKGITSVSALTSRQPKSTYHQGRACAHAIICRNP